MDYLPIFIDVRARACLVVGGGEVAARKVELLRGAGAEVRVVAPALCAELEAEAGAGRLRVERRPYAADDLVGAWLVIAATSAADVNARVAADAKRRAIPVNVVDEPALCTFVMPAIVDRSPVLVAVSTAGASPVLARLTRARVEVALPERLGQLASFAARFRASVKARIADPRRRRAFWERVLSGEVADLVLDGADDAAARALEAQLARDEPPGGRGRLTVLGVGSGEVDRLTLRAVRALGSADLILFESAARPVLAALGRRDAAREKIGALHAHDERTLELLAERVAPHIADGRHVCVVWMGDPLAGSDENGRRMLTKIVPSPEILGPGHVIFGHGTPLDGK
jgi:uroporphyrin-III C-methyltransferase/precorrin-2 dehydrogenase/sirohydrochlorin ferrochelatase